MAAYFAKHGHRMVDLIFDAARFENSEGNKDVYDELGVTPKAIAPGGDTERNRAERSIQTFIKCLCASQSLLGGIFWQ